MLKVIISVNPYAMNGTDSKSLVHLKLKAMPYRAIDSIILVEGAKTEKFSGA